MATYVIGDTHGCYYSLLKLLAAIRYQPNKDKLQFIGDLVNTGLHSLSTLRFIHTLNHCTVILGNHDLTLLAMYYGVIQCPPKHSLQRILDAADCDQLMNWLIQQPLFQYTPAQKTALVHAGIPPQWTLSQTHTYANQLSVQLQQTPIPVLQAFFAPATTTWHPELDASARWNYIANALTRLRFCQSNGTLDLTNKTKHANLKNDKPWFCWYQQDATIFFGHWASICGASTNSKCIALDTGCVYGNQLSAYHVESKRIIQVECEHDDIQPKAR